MFPSAPASRSLYTGPKSQCLSLHGPVLGRPPAAPPVLSSSFTPPAPSSRLTPAPVNIPVPALYCCAWPLACPGALSALQNSATPSLPPPVPCVFQDHVVLRAMALPYRSTGTPPTPPQRPQRPCRRRRPAPLTWRTPACRPARHGTPVLQNSTPPARLARPELSSPPPPPTRSSPVTPPAPRHRAPAESLWPSSCRSPSRSPVIQPAPSPLPAAWPLDLRSECHLVCSAPPHSSGGASSHPPPQFSSTTLVAAPDAQFHTQPPHHPHHPRIPLNQPVPSAQKLSHALI